MDSAIPFGKENYRVSVENKTALIIPLVPKASLVSYTVAISVRGKNAEIRRNRLAAWWGGLRPMSRSRKKDYFGPPRRNFGRHVNSQPVVDRNFYSLRKAHTSLRAERKLLSQQSERLEWIKAPPYGGAAS
jgi:hypothetical protein